MVCSMAAQRVTKQEIDAWREFTRAHAIATRRIECELLAAHQISLPEYTVLVRLYEAPEHRLRMSDLAEGVFLSRSGMTRLVDRMQTDGLIERAMCETDLRVTYAQLTQPGYARLRECSGTLLRGVRTHVTGKLAPADVAQLGALMSRISAG
jgi:DNA-binding MarR family transcriptional regulator